MCWVENRKSKCLNQNPKFSGPKHAIRIIFSTLRGKVWGNFKSALKMACGTFKDKITSMLTNCVQMLRNVSKC